MTIDERLEKISSTLDRLAERHEALTQTVEIMAAEGQRLQKMSESNEALTQKMFERHEALTQTVEIMVSEGQRLQKLVESHERRLTRLEGGSAA